MDWLILSFISVAFGCMIFFGIDVLVSVNKDEKMKKNKHSSEFKYNKTLEDK